MSPVSRGRKPKKQKKSRGGRAASHRSPFRAQWFGPVERPRWFDPALAIAVAETADLALSSGPRELEEATARLVGARLHAAEGVGATRFGAWTEELVDALAGRVRDGDAGWRGAWYCLHGLLSITPAGMAEWVGEVVEQLRPSLPQDAGPQLPGWLAGMPNVSATGEVWRMVDAYGDRIGLIAGFRYPEPAEPRVYLLDFDASDFPVLVSAGVHDDLDAAAKAWRDELGSATAGAEPQPVTEGADLGVLARWNIGELLVTGYETRIVMDNWYRSQRRADDLIEVLAQRGVRLPPLRPVAESDIEPVVKAFTSWYTARHGRAPATEPTEVLAAEWCEVALPGTEHAVSPRRIQTLLRLLGHWGDGPTVDGVRELLPDWIRWNAAETGLTADLVDASLAAVVESN
jgi:hypothetical protein